MRVTTTKIFVKNAAQLFVIYSRLSDTRVPRTFAVLEAVVACYSAARDELSLLIDVEIICSWMLADKMNRVDKGHRFYAWSIITFT